MNKVERIIHQSLEGRPALRNALKAVYQATLSLTPSRNINAHKVVARPNCFYGFHTTCPWSIDDRYLLTHKFSTSDMSLPGRGQTVELGIFYGADFTEYRRITESKIWNWQQGSMLQWMGSRNYIIFNDWLEGAHRARVADTDGLLMATFDLPVGAVSPDGSSYISYSFDRLSIGLKGYGYSHRNSADSLAAGEYEQALVLVNTRTGDKSVLFTLDDMIQYKWRDSFKGAFHFFSHCLYSPSGASLMFFHRWGFGNDDVKTRALVYHFSSKKLTVLPLGDYVSHASWFSEDQALLYAEDLKEVRGYFLVSCWSSSVENIGRGAFTSDGHPQVQHALRTMVTDTYPDRFRKQNLYSYDLDSGMEQLLLSLRIPFKYRNDVRCDFHPRWDRHGRTISFDSAHTGVRSHCTLRVDGHG